MYYLKSLMKQGSNIQYFITPDLSDLDNITVVNASGLKALLLHGVPIVDCNGTAISYNMEDDSLDLSNNDVEDITNIILSQLQVPVEGESDESDESDDYLFDEDDFNLGEDNEEASESYDDYFDDEDDYLDIDDVIEESEENLDEDFEEDFEETSEETTEDYYDDYFDDEEDDLEDEEDSTVSKLYALLNDEQIKVLKRYYLWYSQRLFTDAQKDPSLGMKDPKRLAKKKADLAELRNTGGLWHYAGFVSLKHFGDGRCTLGHKLKYMHLAWDVSVSDIETAFFGENYDKDFEEAINSNNCIIFGIKCISDFFEVSPECTRALQQAQRESLKDMAILYDYYSQGIQDEVNATFVNTDVFMNKLMTMQAKKHFMVDNYKPLVNEGLLKFYIQFRECGLVPPKSLIQEIRDKIVGWGYHKFSATLNLHEVLTTIHVNYKDIVPYHLQDTFASVCNKYLSFPSRGYCGSFYSNYKDSLAYYIAMLFAHKFCGYYQYDAENQKDEGGRSKVAKTDLQHLHKKSLSLISNYSYTFDEFIAFLELVNKVDEYAKFIKDDIKIAFPSTMKDFDNPVTWDSEPVDIEYYSVNSHYLRSKLADLDIDIEDFFSARDFIDDALELKVSGGKNVFFSKMELDFITPESMETLSARLETEKTKLVEYVNNISTYYTEKVNSYNSKIEEAKSKHAVEVAEEENRQRELKAQRDIDLNTEGIVTPKDLGQFLIRNRKYVDELTDSDLSLAKKILDTVSKSEDGNVSNNQLFHLNKLYSALTGLTIETAPVTKTKLSDCGDMEEAIKYVLKHKDTCGLSERTLSICSSIIRYGFVSEKQRKYGEEAINVWKSLEGH